MSSGFTLLERTFQAWRESAAGGLSGQLLDAVDDMIFVKDLDGAYAYNNAAHLAFLGKRREEVLGRTDFDLFPAEEAEVFFAHDTRLLDAGKPVVSVHPARDAEGGAVVDVALKKVVVDADGALAGLVGVVKRVPVDPHEARDMQLAGLMGVVRRVTQERVDDGQLYALKVNARAVLEQLA